MDFLVGFTIFILSLIMVANFVPSLLVGLQRTSGIDYDAVAYRTGVVLVEDPGETNPAQQFPIGGEISSYTMDWRPWELRVDKDQVSRFGLALARDTPNILSINKINKFFGCTTFSYSESLGEGLGDSDYREKLLFSSYQYGYNITLQNISPMKPGEPLLHLSIGEPYPAGYGYIRRYVVIKQNSNGAAINLNQRPEFNATSDGQPVQKFWIHLDGSVLYNKSIDTPFILDLQREPLIINISGLHFLLNNSDSPGNNTSPIACKSNLTAYNSGQGVPPGFREWNGSAPTNATLTRVDFGPTDNPQLWTTFIHSCDAVELNDAMCVKTLSIDGNNYQFPLTGGVNVADMINLSANHIDAEYFNQGSDLVITFTFQNNPPQTLVNGEYLYDYNRTNVTQPFLSTGMLEVGIW
ncbi:MAG: hypothetical protein ABSD81_06385 [Methanomicrobiales archaeon]